VVLGALKEWRIIVSSIVDREVSIPLGIVVEKRKSSHPWADWVWKPTAVFLNGSQDASWDILMSGDDFVQYHAATLSLTLHRKETEALRLNLMLDQPELYVVLQENEDAASEFPYVPLIVTASSYEAQDYHDAGDDIIEKIAMPEAVAAFVQAFVEEHHVDVEFIKRRRDRLNTEEQKFGKTPIFKAHTKH